MGRRIGLYLVLLGFCCLAGNSAHAIICYTPSAWHTKLVSPVMDANGNFVEDTLEGIEDVPIAVIVDLNKCAQPQDIERLDTIGRVGYVGRYLSFVVLYDVLPSTLPLLAMDPVIAFIEENATVFSMLDVSREVVGADTVESSYGLLGSDINIAILDTGVDDGVHVGLPSGAFVGGLVCVPCSCSGSGDACFSDGDCGAGESCSCSCLLTGEDCMVSTDCEFFPVDACLSTGSGCKVANPDDTSGHGTHVASIALGRGGGDCGPDCRGVAPAAGLVDVQVVTADRVATVDDTMVGLEELMLRREMWDVRVANMSLGTCTESDGTDALSQLVNRAVYQGLVVAISAGNNPNCGLGPGASFVVKPAAADDGISVAAIHDMNTVLDADDDLDLASMQGPRTDDGDIDSDDEDKPDIAAPGTMINAADNDSDVAYSVLDGTSMASPHVAGCAALVLDANSDMLPLSVRKLLLDTAVDKGPEGWDPAWGQGALDCFAAVDELATTVGTDLGFEVFFCKEGGPPCWNSPDLGLGSETVTEGVPNTVFATVTNFGKVDAPTFEVKLGVFNYGNPEEDYHICTAEVLGPLEPGGTATVACDYLPMISGEPPGAVHACIKAQVIYPFDTDFDNQLAQKNILVRQAFSPADYEVYIANPTDQHLDITLNATLVCECPPAGSGVFQCPCEGWVFETDTPVIPLGPDDCPVTAELRLEPVDPAVAQRRAAADVAVIGIDLGTGEETPLSGVTLEAELGCQTDGLTFETKQNFFWIPPIYQSCPDFFDVATGPIPIQPQPGSPSGDFANANCRANNTQNNNLFVPETPPSGQGFWYLTTTDDNQQAPGTWNTRKQRGSRDATLHACR